MTDYSIDTELAFSPLQLIDIPSIVDSCGHPWFNQSLCAVNDCVVRVGILKGEFHWHKHDDEDEFFFVIDGQLFIDLEERTVELGPKQGFMVPRGIVHNTRAPNGVVVLMMEGKVVLDMIFCIR